MICEGQLASVGDAYDPEFERLIRRVLSGIVAGVPTVTGIGRRISTAGVTVDIKPYILRDVLSTWLSGVKISVECG